MIKFLQIVAAILAATTVQVWVDNQNPFFLAYIAKLNSNFNFNLILSWVWLLSNLPTTHKSRDNAKHD